MAKIYHYLINVKPVTFACGTTKDGSIGLHPKDIAAVNCSKCIKSASYKTSMSELKKKEVEKKKAAGEPKKVAPKKTPEPKAKEKPKKTTLNTKKAPKLERKSVTVVKSKPKVITAKKATVEAIKKKTHKPKKVVPIQGDQIVEDIIKQQNKIVKAMDKPKLKRLPRVKKVVAPIPASVPVPVIEKPVEMKPETPKPKKDKFDELGDVLARFNEDEMDRLRLSYEKAKRRVEEKE